MDSERGEMASEWPDPTARDDESAGPEGDGAEPAVGRGEPRTGSGPVGLALSFGTVASTLGRFLPWPRHWAASLSPSRLVGGLRRRLRLRLRWVLLFGAAGVLWSTSLV